MESEQLPPLRAGPWWSSNSTLEQSEDVGGSSADATGSNSSPEHIEGDRGTAAPRPPLRLAPDTKLEANANERRALLVAMSPDAAPDEKVLLELAADELRLLDVLRDAQLQVALRLVVRDPVEHIRHLLGHGVGVEPELLAAHVPTPLLLHLALDGVGQPRRV